MSVTLPFDSDTAFAELRSWLSRSPQKSGSRRKRFESSASRGSRGVEIADPEDVSSFERWRQQRYQEYFGKDKRRSGDPRDQLPILPEDTASTLARRYGTSPERLEQALALHSHGLHGKAKRLPLCGRLGHRINHQKSRGACHRGFFEPYLCREKYCTFCGPEQFRKIFAKLLNALTPVVEKLLCQGARGGREMVIAKIDFTIPNDGHMPEPEKVQRFHADLGRFWRAAERQFGIKSGEYGIARCDEVGGDNTNLHAHGAYVGPRLPQKQKELSALWSITLLLRENPQRGRELMRFARKHGLGEVWDQLAPEERRFVSIKRARTFAGALAHALKYPAKFLNKSSPQRLAALEATFHRTRRVSTGGAFYRIKEVHEPGEDRGLEHTHCPFCKVRLVQVHEPWQPLSTLESEGRINLRDAEREAGLLAARGNRYPP